MQIFKRQIVAHEIRRIIAVKSHFYRAAGCIAAKRREMLPAKPLRKRKRQRVAPLLSIGKRPIGKAKANSVFIGFGGFLKKKKFADLIAIFKKK